MAIPFKRYGYTLNPLTDEIETPQIFIVDKQLHRLGELYPVENLQITINEVNNADEVSFTYYKEIDGEPCPSFENLDDLCVIQVEGYGYFECSISKKETSFVSKDIVAQSLGYAELSQILATLEVNTDDDTLRKDYEPTVFYRNIPLSASNEDKKKLCESSLLHRILTYAPHYEIGTVDETLRNVQRTFSWDDTDIITILNDIASEVNCVYDIQTYLTDDNQTKRIINFYDMQYCSKCWNEARLSGKIVSPSKYRNIVNDVCQNCHSGENLVGVGEDTDIFISTDQLSDEITIQGDKDNVKNCFKIVGGDDNITDTVQGLNMSANNRIMLFSDLQKKHMSDELVSKLYDYNKDYNNNIVEYESLLKTEYDLEDVILYLQNGKMPQIEKEITTTDNALYSVLEKIKTLYNNQFFMKSFGDYSYVSAKNSISNMFTTFMPEGYSFMIDTDDITRTSSYQPSTQYLWFGKIKVYSTGDRDDSYTLHVTTNQGVYVTHGESTNHYVTSDSTKQNYVNNFSVCFTFADSGDNEIYRKYIEHHLQYILSTMDVSYENEKKKNWGDYCYNRLNSMYSGYVSCLNELYSMQTETISGTGGNNIITQIIENYYAIQNDIHKQMLVLQDQIFALCSYRGKYLDDFVDENGNVTYTLQYYSNIDDIFNHIISSNFIGGYNSNNIYKVNEFIGTKPIKCKKCGSNNVSVSTTGNICRNNECTGSGNDIYSYLDVMRDISTSYTNHKNTTVKQMRNNYQRQFNITTYLGSQLYNELLSFIREDIYQNNNYTSVGLNNTEIIDHAKELKIKAEQELSKACNIQYTITASLSAILGQKGFTYNDVEIPDEYSKFMINNFVRVQIDGIVYKMRISSLSYSFPISDKIDVTFTNVSTGAEPTMSDISDVIKNASSIATSYKYVATQAEKGEMASTQFDVLKNEGLNAGLIAVKAGQNQDVVIDEHGILLRRNNIETGEYDGHQMKMINQNIVMTDDNWEHAKMAIGLGMYGKDKDGNPMPVYGVWADVLMGDLTVTKELHVKNDNNTVVIDENGITLDGGAIKWRNNNKLPPTAVEGYDLFKENVRKMLGATTITADSVISPKIGGGYLYIKDSRTTGNTGISVEINPSGTSFGEEHRGNYVFNISKGSYTIMGVKNDGSGYFAGQIMASSGKIGKWTIDEYGWLIGNQSDNDPKGTGISWLSSDGKTNFSLNGDNLEMSKDGDLKIRLNTHGSTIDSSDENCLYADVGCISLASKGIIYLKSYSGLADFDNTNLILHNGKYIMSNLYLDNTRLALFGESPSNNIWIGHYNYDNTGGRNSIFLNASKVQLTKYAQLYTPDGTVSKSDKRIKKEIVDMDSKAVDFILGLKPSKYKLEHGTSGRYHFGFIAQDVEETMQSTVGDSGLLIKTEIGTSDDENYAPIDFDDENTYQYGLRYEEFIAPMVATIQNLNDRINEQQKEIDSLKERLEQIEKRLL